MVRLLKYLCFYRLICGHCARHECCTNYGRRTLVNSHAWIVEWEWKSTMGAVVGGACTLTSSACAMGIMTMKLYNNNWSHNSDSLLGMTPVISGAYCIGQLIPNDLPTGEKADIRVQIELRNEGNITLWDRQSWPGVCGRDECNRPSGPVLFISYSCLVTHSSQYTVATHLIEVRKVLSLPKWLNHSYPELNWLYTVPVYRANNRSASLSAPYWSCHCHIYP